MELEPPGAAFFCLEPEPEPTQVGRSWSRSRLRDLGDLEPEPEPPKKVAALQHCFLMIMTYFRPKNLTLEV